MKKLSCPNPPRREIKYVFYSKGLFVDCSRAETELAIVPKSWLQRMKSTLKALFNRKTK